MPEPTPWSSVAAEPAHLPTLVGLCPDPEHTSHFYLPLDVGEPPVCPMDCPERLVVYGRFPEGVTRWEEKQILGWVEATRRRNVELENANAARDERVLDLEAEVRRLTTRLAECDSAFETVEAVAVSRGEENRRLRAFVEQVAEMGGANPWRDDARAALEGGGEHGA